LKVILEFTLPEEKEEYDLAMNGHVYKRAIDEFDEKLRQLWKYQDQKSIDIQEARKMLHEIVEEMKD
jgi:SMC interacting uncharacterized protein involved in chromosome segregation